MKRKAEGSICMCYLFTQGCASVLRQRSCPRQTQAQRGSHATASGSAGTGEVALCGLTSFVSYAYHVSAGECLAPTLLSAAHVLRTPRALQVPPEQPFCAEVICVSLSRSRPCLMGLPGSASSRQTSSLQRLCMKPSLTGASQIRSRRPRPMLGKACSRPPPHHDSAAPGGSDWAASQAAQSDVGLPGAATPRGQPRQQACCKL